MKTNPTEVLSNLNKLQQSIPARNETFPTSKQIQDYLQLSHKLRSMAFAEIFKISSDYFHSQWAQLASFWHKSKSLAELEQLNSFMLKDIGLTRVDIESIRYGSTTVEELNERRLNGIGGRFGVNSKIDLTLCKCNEKVVQEIVKENSPLAKCG